ncbi:MAG: 1,4-dihydroxy-2-naphthoate polyprenyltransferase [bacterium]|nr:1,4-dihydroxy-2-naphthoate polyprenyltransferase [bacterium]
MGAAAHRLVRRCRRHRRRDQPGVALDALRAGGGTAPEAALLRPDRRALGGVLRSRAGARHRPSGVAAADLGHRRRQLPAGGGGGGGVAHAAAGADRRSTGGAGRLRRQPDHRSDPALRRSRSRVLRPRRRGGVAPGSAGTATDGGAGVLRQPPSAAGGGAPQRQDPQAAGAGRGGERGGAGSGGGGERAAGAAGAEPAGAPVAAGGRRRRPPGACLRSGRAGLDRLRAGAPGAGRHAQPDRRARPPHGLPGVARGRQPGALLPRARCGRADRRRFRRPARQLRFPRRPDSRADRADRPRPDLGPVEQVSGPLRRLCPLGDRHRGLAGRREHRLGPAVRGSRRQPGAAHHPAGGAPSVSGLARALAPGRGGGAAGRRRGAGVLRCPDRGRGGQGAGRSVAGRQPAGARQQPADPRGRHLLPGLGGGPAGLVPTWRQRHRRRGLRRARRGQRVAPPRGAADRRRELPARSLGSGGGEVRDGADGDRGGAEPRRPDLRATAAGGTPVGGGRGLRALDDTPRDRSGTRRGAARPRPRAGGAARGARQCPCRGLRAAGSERDRGGGAASRRRRAEPAPAAANRQCPGRRRSVTTPAPGSLRRRPLGGPAKAWLLASRPQTLAAAFVPVLVGAACAFTLGGLRWGPTLAALWGAIWIQIGTNFANDVFDYEKGADASERLGPLRAVQAGLLTPAQMRRGMWLAFTLATAAGVYLTWVAGWPIVAIGVASVLSGIAYTGGPYPLGYHGLGDVFVLIFFGFVAVCGTAFINLGEVPALAWWAAVPVGCLATAILVVNNVRDREGDRAAGKRTLVARLGRRAGVAEYVLLLAAAYLTPIWLFRDWASPLIMLPLITLPRAGLLVAQLVEREGRELNETLVGTARLMVLYGVLFAAGIVLGR